MYNCYYFPNFTTAIYVHTHTHTHTANKLSLASCSYPVSIILLNCFSSHVVSTSLCPIHSMHFNLASPFTTKVKLNMCSQINSSLGQIHRVELWSTNHMAELSALEGKEFGLSWPYDGARQHCQPGQFSGKGVRCDWLAGSPQWLGDGYAGLVEGLWGGTQTGLPQLAFCVDLPHMQCILSKAIRLIFL